MKDRHLTLTQLQQILGDLLCTRAIALQKGLLDAHAHQLVDRIADALNVVEQLIVL
jgi:hypothetical protein